MGYEKPRDDYVVPNKKHPLNPYDWTKVYNLGTSGRVDFATMADILCGKKKSERASDGFSYPWIRHAIAEVEKHCTYLGSFQDRVPEKIYFRTLLDTLYDLAHSKPSWDGNWGAKQEERDPFTTLQGKTIPHWRRQIPSTPNPGVESKIAQPTKHKSRGFSYTPLQLLTHPELSPEYQDQCSAHTKCMCHGLAGKNFKYRTILGFYWFCRETIESSGIAVPEFAPKQNPPEKIPEKQSEWKSKEIALNRLVNRAYARRKAKKDLLFTDPFEEVGETKDTLYKGVEVQAGLILFLLERVTLPKILVDGVDGLVRLLLAANDIKPKEETSVYKLAEVPEND